MAYPGHRWQSLRVSLVLAQHLTRVVTGLPLVPARQSECQEHLAAAYRLIETDRVAEAAAPVQAMIGRLREEVAAGNIRPAPADEAIQAAQRLLELLGE